MKGPQLWVVRNLTDDARLINEDRQRPIRVDGDMEGFVDHEVVARSLANDLEIVFEGLFKANLAIEGSLCFAGRLILLSCDKASAAKSLWLVVELGMEAALVIDNSKAQKVK